MSNTPSPATSTFDRLRYGVQGAQQRALRQEEPITNVRIGGRYDENNVPYVRLTRTVQTGFGIGVGIWLAMMMLAIPTGIVLGLLGAL